MKAVPQIHAHAAYLIPENEPMAKRKKTTGQTRSTARKIVG